MRNTQTTAMLSYDLKRFAALGYNPDYSKIPYGLYDHSKFDTPYLASSVNRSDITVNSVDASGWRKPSPYAAAVVTDSPTVIRCLGHYSWFYKYDFYEEISGRSLHSQAMNALRPTPLEVDEVLVRALNNVADRKASFAESAAEAIKTAAGLGDNAKQISKFIGAAVKRDYRGAALALGLTPKSRKARRARDRVKAAGEGFSSFWLNYWFGLAPIVSDMVSIAAFLSDESVHNRLRVKGASQKTFTRSESTYVHRSGGYFSGPAYDLNWSIAGVGKVRVSLEYAIRSASLRRLVTFGAVDVPSTLWAIAPGSFLVDWVLPVSEILKAYTADSFLEFRGGTATKIAEAKVSNKKVSGRPDPYISTDTLEYVLGEYRNFEMDRTVYTSSPKPVTIWVKDPFDLWKSITSLALLSSKLKTS